jgi:2-polyprenyl-3-methyl-5-hydroxy-6-metoxy-1,4-benzoquinol methylase
MPQSAPAKASHRPNNLKLRAYARAERWFTGAGSVLRALHEGFWLGMMSSEDLLGATSIRFDPPSSFHTREHNLSGLFDWEETAVQRFFGSCRSVLIGAAGAGREAITLAQRGFEVTAFECHPGLVEQGRALVASLQLPIEFLRADPSQVPACLGVYDGMILGWDALSHVPSQAERVALLRECGSHVRNDGPLLLSFQARFPGRRHALVSRVASLVRRLRGDQLLAEEGDTLTGDFRHTFTREEIEQALDSAGFEMVFYSDSGAGHAVGVRNSVEKRETSNQKEA